VPEVPFSKINEIGAGMYKGVATNTRIKGQAPEIPSGLGGSTPTYPLHYDDNADNADNGS
jgi:hypothetical protein